MRAPLNSIVRRRFVLTSALRLQLLLPPVVPLTAFLAVIYLFDSQGSVSDRHSSIGMLILLFVLLPMAAAVEIGALRKAVPILVRNPESRTVASVLSALVGIAFLASCVWAIFCVT
jgi:hypothetical protein